LKQFYCPKTIPEWQAFSRDLGALSEIEAMTERFRVIQMLNKNVRKVSKKTGSSIATVSRVAYSSHHHDEGGYKLVLERLN